MCAHAFPVPCFCVCLRWVSVRLPSRWPLPLSPVAALSFTVTSPLRRESGAMTTTMREWMDARGICTGVCACVCVCVCALCSLHVLVLTTVRTRHETAGRAGVRVLHRLLMSVLVHVCVFSCRGGTLVIAPKTLLPQVCVYIRSVHSQLYKRMPGYPAFSSTLVHVTIQ